MGRIILAFVLLLPLVEIAGFIWVGGMIGIFPTLATILLTAIIGILIVRLQGLGLVLDSRAMMARGEVPAQNFAHGMMLAIAGFFLLVPGFFTDMIGFLLLVPPIRSAIYAFLSRNMVVVTTYRPGSGGPGTRAIDLDPDSYR